jgi:hypothetical protein
MLDFCTGDSDRVRSLYREPLFDKCLEDLRTKGGFSTEAARKVDQFIDIVLKPDRHRDREKFRFTRNCEARIKHCKKVDLGCGYRLVCIKKDGRLALLYVGTHDDCFRWIEHNKGLEYDFDAANTGVQAVRQAAATGEEDTKSFVEGDISDLYEASLMSRIDDHVLRRVFRGLCASVPSASVQTVPGSAR